jgi:hypothetical protein
MERLVALATLVAVTLFAAASAQAADIKVVAPGVVTVSGRLNKGDSIKFFVAIEKMQNATVYFESIGGNASAGIGIGEIIHERGFHTAVLNYRICVSACAIAWLGGTKRFTGLGSIVGFHTPYIKVRTKESITYGTTTIWGVNTVRSERGASMVRGYVTGMLGLGGDAALYVTKADPIKVNILTPEDGQKYGIQFERRSLSAYNPLP